MSSNIDCAVMAKTVGAVGGLLVGLFSGTYFWSYGQSVSRLAQVEKINNLCCVNITIQPTDSCLSATPGYDLSPPLMLNFCATKELEMDRLNEAMPDLLMRALVCLGVAATPFVLYGGYRVYKRICSRDYQELS